MLNLKRKHVWCAIGAGLPTALRINGPLYRPLAWKVVAAGEFDHILYQAPPLPGPVGLVKGSFRYVPDKLSFGLKEATILDSTVTGTAVVSGITTTVGTVDMTLDGSSGRKTVEWAFENLKLPPELMIKTPLAFSGAHLVWDRNKGASFSGTASVAGTLLQNALIIHAIGAPIYFSVVSLIYFKKFNFTTPLQTAIIFTGFVVAVDFFVVALMMNKSLEMFASLPGTWIPFALIFASTYLTGFYAARRYSRYQ